MRSDLSNLNRIQKSLNPITNLGGSLDITWCNPLDFRRGTSGGQAPKSSSVVLSTLPHCLPAIPLYFSFSKLCDLSVWGHERLITSVWTRRTVGRPCENFSHTLVPTGLGPELHTPVILSSCRPPWSQPDPPWQPEPKFWDRDPWDTAATQLIKEPVLDVFTFILKLVSDQRHAGTLPSWRFNPWN